MIHKRRAGTMLAIVGTLASVSSWDLAHPAATLAAAVGTASLSASGNSTQASEGGRTDFIWNHAVTWTTVGQPIGDLPGESLADATGSTYIAVTTETQHEWTPPPDYTPETVRCFRTDVIEWTGTIRSTDAGLASPPQIGVSRSTVDPTPYIVRASVWMPAATRTVTTWHEGSDDNPFCPGFLDGTASQSTWWSLEFQDSAVMPVPDDPDHLFAAGKTIPDGVVDPSGAVDSWGGATNAVGQDLATVSYDLRAGVGGYIDVTGVYAYSGSVLGADGGLATGVDTGTVTGDSGGLARVARTCIRSYWTVTTKLAAPTSIPIFWNGQVFPFTEAEGAVGFEGWEPVSRSAPRRNGLYDGTYAETVRITTCEAGLTATRSLTIAIVVAGAVVSFKHSLDVEAYDNGNGLLGRVSVKAASARKLSWAIGGTNTARFLVS